MMAGRRPTSTTSTITVIVVVHRWRQDETSRCLASVGASQGVDAQLLVAYNGTETDCDTVRRAVEALGGHFLRVPINRGFAHAVNRAVTCSDPSTDLFLLNDDAWLLPMTLAYCAAALAAATDAVVAQPVVVRAEDHRTIDSFGLVLRANGEAFNAWQGRFVTEIEQPAVAASPRCTSSLGPSFAAALFRCGALQPVGVGPLDERYFMYYEDVDWCIRAHHLHRDPVVLVPSAVVVHEQGATANAELNGAQRFRVVQRNLLRCASINLSARGARHAWGQSIVRHAKGVITGPYRIARVSAVLSALLRLPEDLRSRRSHRGTAPSDDALLFALGAEPGDG